MAGAVLICTYLPRYLTLLMKEESLRIQLLLLLLELAGNRSQPHGLLKRYVTTLGTRSASAAFCCHFLESDYI